MLTILTVATATGSITLPPFPWGDLLTQALPVISAGVLAALAWLSALVGRLLVARLQAGYARDVLGRLNAAAYAVVARLEQRTVAAIREAAADGKLTPDEQVGIQRTALDELKSYVGPKGLAEVARILIGPGVPVDQYLGAKIEEAVVALKATQPMRLKATTGTVAGAWIPPVPQI